MIKKREKENYQSFGLLSQKTETSQKKKKLLNFNKQLDIISNYFQFFFKKNQLLELYKELKRELRSVWIRIEFLLNREEEEGR